MKTSLDIAIEKASHELNIPSELVESVYKAYWLVIRQAILTLPLKEDLTEEDFSKLRASFNIPSLGKLYSSYDRVQGVKRRFSYLQLIRNNDCNKKTLTDVY